MISISDEIHGNKYVSFGRIVDNPHRVTFYDIPYKLNDYVEIRMSLLFLLKLEVYELIYY